MKIKYLEWNLHAMGGEDYKEIPGFIKDYLQDVDIFILTEFRQADNFHKFKDDLKDFDLYCSPYVPVGYNQVCIGVKKALKYEVFSVRCDACDTFRPELLDVGIKVKLDEKNMKNIRIVGTRIKTECERKPQIDYLKGYLKNIECFICLGDYNAVYATLKKEFSEVGDVVYGPRISNGYYSFVHTDNNKVGLDWLISKGIESVYNGYDDKKESPYATYDWNFVNNSNGYGEKTEKEYLGIKGLPDHAILKGMVEI